MGFCLIIELLIKPREIVAMKKNNRSPTDKKNKSKVPSAWKQTGLCFSDSTMVRLRLESVKTSMTMSEIAESTLDKHLPNNRIAS
jgi:hypothetical protein